MDVQKLKTIIHKANNNLKTTSFSLIQSSQITPDQFLAQEALNSIRCHGCDETRRQNYQLKQQLCELEDRQVKIIEGEKQAAALKQLYDLKCQQVELLRKELRSEKQKNNFIQQRTNGFCQSSIDTISRKLKEIESGPSKYLSF